MCINQTALPSHHLRTSYLVFLLVGLLVTLPQAGTAQSAWTNPFETPEEQNDEESPYGTWGTPQHDEDRNAWTTDDPWNTNDPWGLEERNRSWGESDWARDFYDFDDENSGGESDSDKGSAERVGDGVAMAAVDPENVECSSNDECTTGQKQTCCITGNGSKCKKNCAQGGGTDNGPLGNDEFIDDNGNVVCTDPNGDCNNPDITLPLPGLVYLLLAGLGYGGYRLRERQAGA